MRRPIVVVALIAVVLAGCGQAATTGNAAAKEDPVEIDEVAGATGLHRITLTDHAARRLGIETVEVGSAQGGRTQVPYSSLIYDAAGKAWTYIVVSSPLVFQRHPVTVDQIVSDTAGDYVLLMDGPPLGASVVSVGVAELFGAEFSVGH